MERFFREGGNGGKPAFISACGSEFVDSDLNPEG